MLRRKWLWVLVAAVVLAGALAIALSVLVDANRYRGLIEERAEAALGRDVRLGRLHLSFFPFGVTADDVAIGALAGEGGGDLLTVEHLRVGARLLPLLSKKLEVTRIVLDGPSVRLERGPDGSWNVERLIATQHEAGPAAGETGPPSAFLVESLRIEGGRIVIHDATSDDPLAVVLSDLAGELRDVAVDRAVQVELSAALSAGGDEQGRIEIAGEAGPLSAWPLPATLSLRLEDMPGPLVGRLTALAGIRAGVREASLTLDLSGSIPDVFDARGALSLTGAEAGTTSFDAELAYDVAAREGATLLEIRSVDLRVWQSTLHVAGTVRRMPDATVVDLQLGPSRIPAADLSAMLALVLGELPATFSSPTPIEVALTARGPLGAGGLPQLAGRLVLADLTVQHSALSVPVKGLGATVELEGERVDLRDIRAVVGASAVAGSASVQGFAAPAIRFDLVSDRADLGELFSLLSAHEGAAGADAPAEAPRATPAPQAAGAATPWTAEGTLSIAAGTFDTLDFRDLRTGVRWKDGVLALDPVSATLYEGSFGGRVVTNLAADPPAFELRGDARAIDLGAFLADNLGQPAPLTGRFTGKVATRGRGLDYESIVRSLDGGGSIEVATGRLGQLDVLQTLSRVSGVFGENTLEQLSGRLAAEGTEFERLGGELRLASGALKFSALRLDAPDFRLDGSGRVDLLTSKLEGEFVLALSPPISAAMLAEKSKAGTVFWNPDTRRVEVPFALSGPFSEPSASIDFRAVARSAAKSRIEQSARELLSERLGLDLGAAREEAAQAAPPVDAPPAAVSESGAATITRTQWSGSLLARDLRIEGAVRLDGVKKAKVSVVDASGRELLADRVSEVDERLAAGKTSGRVDWRVEIDGEKLLAAAMPLTVRLVVQHQDGTTSQAETSVSR